ncbi:hypothetical protein J507_1976 [Acinetobacter sp. 1295259]|nr:hypothetical protein J507_1976 [Acinetobacter sp. 1295259]
MTHWQSFSIIFQTRLSFKDEIYDKAVHINYGLYEKNCYRPDFGL